MLTNVFIKLKERVKFIFLCPLSLSLSLFDFQKINPFSLFAGKNEWEPACVCVCLCWWVCVCVIFSVKEVKNHRHMVPLQISHTHTQNTQIFTQKYEMHVVIIINYLFHSGGLKPTQ